MSNSVLKQLVTTHSTSGSIILCICGLVAVLQFHYLLLETNTALQPERINFWKVALKKAALESRETAIYAQRQSLVKNVCKVYKSQSQNNSRYSNVTKVDENILRMRMLWSYNYKFVFCPIAKTGTSTWMRHLRNLTHLPKEVSDDWEWVLHKWMPLVYRMPDFPVSDILRILDDNLKFIFVRHPFVRIVSTYQDKTIDHPLYRKWREMLQKQFKHDGDPTFKEFVTACFQGDIIMGDPHLLPMWKTCDLCNIDYDVIGKLETWDEDNAYIFYKTGIGQEELNQDLRMHASSGGPTEEMTRQLFSTLPTEMIDKLYQFYKEDFELFGYSPTEYYHNEDLTITSTI